MKILKWILIVVVAIVAIFFIYNSTQPNKIAVEESIVIDAPPAVVFTEVVDFKKWKNWSAWEKKDPNMVQTYSGTPGTIGYHNSWKSDVQEVGSGRQEVVEVSTNEYIRTKMNFEGWDADNYATFKFEKVEDGKTKVTWDMDGAETPFLMNFINGLMRPSIVESYQESLAALKETIESRPTTVLPENVKIIDMNAIDIVSIKDSTNAQGISGKLAELYTELSIYMETQELEMNGMPLAIYYSYDPDKVILEAAMPYSGSADVAGRVMVKQTPSGKTIMGTHYGDYAASGEIHYAIEKYAEAEGIEFKEMCWEVYANDPTTVDSAAVETHIYYPIKAEKTDSKVES